jgi:hypothetical protein
MDLLAFGPFSQSLKPGSALWFAFGSAPQGGSGQQCGCWDKDANDVGTMLQQRMNYKV